MDKALCDGPALQISAWNFLKKNLSPLMCSIFKTNGEKPKRQPIQFEGSVKLFADDSTTLQVLLQVIIPLIYPGIKGRKEGIKMQYENIKSLLKVFK